MGKKILLVAVPVAVILLGFGAYTQTDQWKFRGAVRQALASDALSEDSIQELQRLQDSKLSWTKYRAKAEEITREPFENYSFPVPISNGVEIVAFHVSMDDIDNQFAMLNFKTQEPYNEDFVRQWRATTVSRFHEASCENYVISAQMALGLRYVFSLDMGMRPSESFDYTLADCE